MGSVNFKGVLDNSSGDSVPEDLLTNAGIIRDEGGVGKIEELFNELPDATTRNMELLQEAIRMLDDEESSDKQLNEQFKERWNRTPSGKLTEGWRGEIQKYHAVLEQAKSFNEVVRTNYKKHSNGIRLLSLSDAELKDHILKSSISNQGSGNSNSVKKMWRALFPLQKVAQLQKKRATVISGLLLSFDEFHYIKSELEEGLKIYGDLTEILLKFQNKVKDYCFARKTEKNKLMKDLQTSIVREKTETNQIRTSNIKATSGGTEVSSQPPVKNEAPARPLPTYQAHNPGEGRLPQQVPGGVQPTVAATASAPNIHPGVMPYPPNPYNMPQQYIPGVPFQQYPYPQPTMQPGQMPQYPPGGFNYPSGYNPYPGGYNQYYPR